MSQSLTLSAGHLMLAVPSLIALGGVVVGIALHGHLTTGIEVARLNADTDERTARWLWQRGYRKTPHAGPDVTEDVPAIEEKFVDAEVPHVDHPTAEHKLPSIADGLAALAEQVALVQALSDRPADDEDEVGDEQPGEAWFAGVARRWQQFVTWLRSLGQSRRERDLIGSGEQATDRDPFAELLAHVEKFPRSPRHAIDVHAQDTGYMGRRWLAGTEHTGLHPIVIPARHDGGEDRG